MNIKQSQLVNTERKYICCCLGFKKGECQWRLGTFKENMGFLFEIMKYLKLKMIMIICLCENTKDH
jgi:hypothetical protein